MFQTCTFVILEGSVVRGKEKYETSKKWTDFGNQILQRADLDVYKALDYIVSHCQCT